MSVPNIQPLLLPVLKAVADGTEHDVNDIRKRVISELRITDEEVNTNHPESQLNVYVNRVAWALVYLLEGKAITKKRSGVYQITKDGKDFLDTGEKISSIKDAKKLCA